MIKIKKRNFHLLIAVFVGSMIASIVLSVSKSKGSLKDNYENDNRVISGLISNVIDNTFLRPIMVAETISNDYTVKKILDIPSKDAAKKVEKEAAEYLASIRDGFGYSMVYAVSDPSKTYFTYKGISKYIDVDNDVNDLWYKNFVAADQKYKLDVDTDAAANWSLSVFVNTAVYNDKNQFIGACGVGVDMTELQRLLEHYERIYDVKINLINESGLIQVDTDTARIEKDYILVNDLSNYADGECYYEVLKNGCRTITYMDNLEWYLIVENQNPLNSNVYNIVTPSVICFIIGFLLFVLVAYWGLVSDNKEDKE